MRIIVTRPQLRYWVTQYNASHLLGEKLVLVPHVTLYHGYYDPDTHHIRGIVHASAKRVGSMWVTKGRSPNRSANTYDELLAYLLKNAKAGPAWGESRVFVYRLRRTEQVVAAEDELLCD